MISFECLITALLWMTTAWRATKVWKKHQKRALWWSFFGLTIMMTLRLPFGASLDRLMHVQDLSYLLKNLFGGILGPAALLTFLRDVSGQQVSPVRLRSWAPPAFAAAVMTALFFTELQPYDTAVILGSPTSRAALLVYTIALLGYLSSSLCSGVVVCWRWRRESGNGALGWGLRVIGVGLALGVLYSVVRITTISARFAHETFLPGNAGDRLASLLLLATLLLTVVGSTLPVLGKVRTWYSARRDLLRLYPLWLDLTGCFPTVRLHAPRSLRAERLDLRDVRTRLYRRGIEIRDAALALSDYATAEMRARAHAHVAARAGGRAVCSATEVDACWLAAARRARIRGDSPVNRHHQQSSGGTDFASEINSLLHLAHAFQSPVTTSFAATEDPSRAPHRTTAHQQESSST